MKLGFAVIAVCLASPAAAQTAMDTYSDALNATPAVVTKPDVGKRTVVTAGEAILDQRNVRMTDGAVIEASIVSPPEIANAFHAVPGDEFYRISSKAAFKACGVKLGAEGAPPCLLDDDGDGVFDRVASNYIRKAYPIDTPVAYRPATVTIPPAVSGFARSLLYQGASGDGLRLSYREFNNNLARPAFEESMTIPLAASFPQKVAVKGAIFTIYQITGLGLDYQIDSLGSFDVNASSAVPPLSP